MNRSPTALDTPPSDTLSAWLQRLRAARHRGTLVLAGEADWCRQAAAQTVRDAGRERVSWISDRVPTASPAGMDVVAPKQARGLLGQERDLIVFDAHAGFDADAFGAVSGSIVGGGLLLLLCPPLEAWPQCADPAAEAIAVWPHTIHDLPGRFLRRLSRLLGQTIAAGGQTVLVSADGQRDAAVQAMLDAAPPTPALSLDNKPPTTSSEMRSADQRAAVAAIEHVLQGHRRRPLVLVADRGRGKTAALGIAAARLMRGAVQGPPPAAGPHPAASFRIVVTAPRLAAVAPLFRHAQGLLPGVIAHPGHLQWGAAELRFVAPDELCAALPEADLLLVDEAAAIPASLLQTLLRHYSRLVFSTTTHGYEGTGRGFAVRFRQTLDAQAPGWSELILREPIRWAGGDPLEQWVFDSLLLDAGCAEDGLVSAAAPGNVQVERLARDRLATDEPLLKQLFGLLVVAHYRTRPNDLRNLLDGPGLAVYAVRYQGAVVATALVAMEGGFDRPLIEAMAAGRRRPRGHLIPQSLVVHLGLPAAGGQRCARVMRIAVHPAVQGRGLGRGLLQYIKAEAKKQGADLVGASFGATAPLLRFWRAEGLWPVRVGFRRDHASGEHSVMVLSALSPAGASVLGAAREGLRADLPLTVADALSDLDPAVVALLLQDRPGESDHQGPSDRDCDAVRAFVEGERSYEDCLASLWRYTVWALRAPAAALPDPQQTILIRRLLQHHSWTQLAHSSGLAGKAALKGVLQSALRQLLSSTIKEDKL